jgi:hypothetical protein
MNWKKELLAFREYFFDPAIAVQFRRETQEPLDDDLQWDAGLSLDFDGMLFVDYLRDALDEAELANDLDFFHTHKNVIVAGAKEFRTKDSAFEKYIWLTNYHNRIVESIPTELLTRAEVSREELIIKRADLHCSVRKAKP